MRMIEGETFENKDLNWRKDVRLERCVIINCNIKSTSKVVLGTANTFNSNTVDVESITQVGPGNKISGNKIKVWKVIREGLE